jgi:hypothetical protein
MYFCGFKMFHLIQNLLLSSLKVTVGKKIADNGKAMVLSCILYMIIQVPVIMNPESSYSRLKLKLREVVVMNRNPESSYSRLKVDKVQPKSGILK